MNPKNWLIFFQGKVSKINQAPAQDKNRPLEPCDSPLVASKPRSMK